MIILQDINFFKNIFKQMFIIYTNLSEGISNKTKIDNHFNL